MSSSTEAFLCKKKNGPNLTNLFVEQEQVSIFFLTPHAGIFFHNQLCYEYFFCFGWAPCKVKDSNRNSPFEDLHHFSSHRQQMLKNLRDDYWLGKIGKIAENDRGHVRQ